MVIKMIRKMIPEPLKIPYRKLRANYRRHQFIKSTKNLAAHTDPTRPAEAAIFIMIAENWNSFESVYQCISSNDRINVTVYVFPGHVFTDTPDALNLKLYDEVLSFFASKGIRVVKAYDTENGTYITPESVKADYVFYDEPYELYPPQFSIRQMHKRARVCYIPYGYMLTNSRNMLSIVIPEGSFQFIYAFFATGEHTADYADRLYDRIGHDYHHVLRFGFPRFDIKPNIQQIQAWGRGLTGLMESALHSQRR